MGEQLTQPEKEIANELGLVAPQSIKKKTMKDRMKIPKEQIEEQNKKAEDFINQMKEKTKEIEEMRKKNLEGMKTKLEKKDKKKKDEEEKSK